MVGCDCIWHVILFAFSCLWMLLEPIVQHTDNFPFLSKLIYNIKQTKDAQDEGDEEQNKVRYVWLLYVRYVCVNINRFNFTYMNMH